MSDIFKYLKKGQKFSLMNMGWGAFYLKKNTRKSCFPHFKKFSQFISEFILEISLCIPLKYSPFKKSCNRNKMKTYHEAEKKQYGMALLAHHPHCSTCLLRRNHWLSTYCAHSHQKINVYICSWYHRMYTLKTLIIYSKN